MTFHPHQSVVLIFTIRSWLGCSGPLPLSLFIRQWSSAHGGPWPLKVTLPLKVGTGAEISCVNGVWLSFGFGRLFPSLSRSNWSVYLLFLRFEWLLTTLLDELGISEVLLIHIVLRSVVSLKSLIILLVWLHMVGLRDGHELIILVEHVIL
jgi:hypothetical protein